MSTQNIVFSILVLAVLIPMAVGGLLSVAGAVVAHEPWPTGFELPRAGEHDSPAALAAATADW